MTLEYSQMPMNHGDGSAAVIVLFWGMNIHLYTRFCEHHFILMPLHKFSTATLFPSHVLSHHVLFHSLAALDFHCSSSAALIGKWEILGKQEDTCNEAAKCHLQYIIECSKPFNRTLKCKEGKLTSL